MGLEEEGHGQPKSRINSEVQGDGSNREIGWGGGNPMPKTSTCKLTNNTKLILIPIRVVISRLIQLF